MTKYTNQEAFDLVVSKIVEQGRPSINEDGKCVYRGPDGTRCAAGWLLPDELYKEEFDEGASSGWSDVSRYSSDLLSLADVSLIERLQGAHDEAALLYHTAFLAAFLERANLVALDFNLKFTKP